MSVSGPKRIEILNRDRGKPCAICNDNDGPFEVDHINPKSNGGGSESDNLQKICRRCNRDKNNYVADEETGALVRPVVHVATAATVYGSEPLFRTLHAETRYSVLRVNIRGPYKRTPHSHDFAILWDEDQDERVLEVAEALTRAKLIDRVLFLGETKGSVIVYVDCARSLTAFEAVEREGFSPCDGDWFHVTVCPMGSGGGPQRLTPGVSALTVHDLTAIKDRWGLGIKDKNWQEAAFSASK